MLEGLFGPSGRKCTFLVFVSFTSRLRCYAFMISAHCYPKAMSPYEEMNESGGCAVWTMTRKDVETNNLGGAVLCVQAHSKVMPLNAWLNEPSL